MNPLPAAPEGMGGDGPASRSCPGGKGTPPGFVTLSNEAAVLSPFLQAGSWGSPATSPEGALVVMRGRRTNSAIPSPVFPVPGLKPCALGVGAGEAQRHGAQKEQSCRPQTPCLIFAPVRPRGNANHQGRG